MPTHKSVREIINGLLIRSCVHCDEPVEAEKGLKEHNEMVDTTIAQLAELVRGEKKKCKVKSAIGRECSECIGWNEALEHIAQKLEGK